MNISALKDGTKKADVTGTIASLGDERSVSLRTGGEARVRDATLKDASGSIKLSLWDDAIEQVSKGAEITIQNGYVTAFRGELQLNVGRYGRMTVA